MTGSARGLGRELCMRFHELGAKVACADVDGEGSAETARAINRQGGTAISYKVDVTDRQQVKAAHAAVRADLGPVDILVNNAGVVMAHMYVNPESDKLIRDLIDVNLLGQIWVRTRCGSAKFNRRVIDVQLHPSPSACKIKNRETYHFAPSPPIKHVFL